MRSNQNNFLPAQNIFQIYILIVPVIEYTRDYISTVIE